MAVPPSTSRSARASFDLRGERRSATLVWLLVRRLLTVAVVALGLASACKKDVGRDDAGADKPLRELPPLTIRNDTPNLLLTWIDLRGGTHVANAPPEVPSEGRTFVRILVNGSEDGATDPIYVADLTHPEGDGAFVARSTPRRDWEAEIAKRRDERLAAGDTPGPTPQAPRPPRPSPGDPDRGQRPPDLDPRDPSGKQGKGGDLSNVDVTVYGASWCGPCHNAMDYLKKRGQKFVFKDVDKDRSARDELERKVARLGSGNTRSIPIIDVGGRLLFGFSTRSLDDALAQAGGGTIL